LNEKVSFFEQDTALAVNSELFGQIEDGMNGAKAERVKNLLSQMGYKDCVVAVEGDMVYITVERFLSPIGAARVKGAVARELSVEEANISLM
jgi:hypothetical protein